MHWHPFGVHMCKLKMPASRWSQCRWHGYHIWEGVFDSCEWECNVILNLRGQKCSHLSLSIHWYLLFQDRQICKYCMSWLITGSLGGISVQVVF